ncbi:hypothetical protein F5B20DRAFT_578927 [Whalleya microplaca]|nr:hypothetical protein F5B20DRAFT_578927 [Whalleya microplaca]
MPSPLRVSFSQQLLYRWDIIFDSHRDIRDHQNKTYYGMKKSYGVSSDVISCFMEASDENDPCHYVTDSVVEFCANANIQSFQHNPSAVNERIALVDDSDEQERRREYRSGLTAWELYQALLKPRWRPKVDDAGASQLPGQLEVPDAEIRRIFIASLDRWAVLALAATGSYHEARVLSEFIFRHLKFDPLVKARILPEGFPMFALEFHLPYFALRRHRLPQMDVRITDSGGALRKHEDITFLWNMDGKVDNSKTCYVYEANLSCMVSGWDYHKWSAHFFIDLYFEDLKADEDLESISDYEAHKTAGIALDPLAGGKKLREMMPRDPRNYFILVLAIRLRKVKKEWELLVTAVDEAIRTYVRPFHFLPEIQFTLSDAYNT